MKCYNCPRKCGIDREKSLGFCGEKDEVRIAKIIPNFMWEEPPISRKNGTYAIFFSGCNLRCEYCQNKKISRGGAGKIYTAKELAKVFMDADSSTSETIDLITPSHFTKQILDAFKIYTPKKPVVYNSSGYDSTEEIEKLAPYVSIFLPDLKYYDQNLSLKYSLAKDYFSEAIKAIICMTKLKKNKFDGENLIEGVIIRHMILPGHVRDSLKILEEIKKNIKKPIISLMSQFVPEEGCDLNRRITPLEYKTAQKRALSLGLNRGYFQELCSSDSLYKPDF